MTIPILTVSCAAVPPVIATAMPRGMTNRAMHLFHIAISAGEGWVRWSAFRYLLSRRHCESAPNRCSLEARFCDMAVAFCLRRRSMDWADRIGRRIRLRDLHILLA